MIAQSLQQYQKIWQFAYEAYKGLGGFANGEYIDKYPRETDEKYKQRKELAYYTNLIAAHINRYVGYIFKTSPIRRSNDKFINAFFDDCDNAGNSLDVFMSNFAKEAKIRGVGLVLIDMPKEIPLTMDEQLNQRAFPYLRNIPPENVTRIKFDEHKNIEFIEFRDIIDLSTETEDKIIEVTRFYDKQKWYVTDNGEYFEQGIHGLGVCPILVFSETGLFPDIGEFTPAAFLAKRHYNLTSELDEILRSQTFSILTVQSDNPDDVEIEVGTDNAIVYGIGANKPEFIAPPASPAAVYMERIKKIEAEIDKICLNFTSTESNESGIALEIKFQNVNSSLSNFAMRLNDFERRIIDVVKTYLDINNDETIISYLTDFSLLDVESEIKTLEEFKSLGYEVPTYERLKLERIINNDLDSLDPETFDLISEEIKQFLIAQQKQSTTLPE